MKLDTPERDGMGLVRDESNSTPGQYDEPAMELTPPRPPRLAMPHEVNKVPLSLPC